ncbi:hypothetical protein ACN20G_36935 (plasmid) [Streptomyces sp. BI20]|uniref:hypothetical protein n=1 Tax=Streptomyces sp. BI20 TaxID=3403460 RepID=UPI003C792DE3
MTAQPTPEPHPIPPMRTLAELRAAVSRYGFDGDSNALERELGAVVLDDLGAVRAIAQAYRHRVLLHLNPAAMAEVMRPTDDVAAELRRRIAEAGAA